MGSNFLKISAFFLLASALQFQLGSTLALALTEAQENDAACSCGVRGGGADKIVGGKDAVRNEFPWRVALFSRFIFSRDYSYFCCGTIINSKFIMTAAHCTRSIIPIFQEIYVSAGSYQLSETKSSTYKRVRRVHNFPTYNPATQDNDFALLEMGESILGANASPICLPFGVTENDYANKMVTASGWGVKKQGSQEVSDTLQTTDLTALTTKDCEGYYDDGQITDNMMCTLTQNKDTCQGDSGGSVDLPDPGTGKYISVGVVSWGDGCAKEDKPGVYAKIEKFLPFVKEKAGDNFCKIRQ